MRRGRLPEIGSRSEVVVGEAFANAHGFQPGNEIAAIIHGARETAEELSALRCRRSIVFEARPGETLPDNRRFGIFWMNERELASAFQLEGAFNNVLIDVAPGERNAPGHGRGRSSLAPYGGLVAYDRSDHASAVRLHDEIRVLHGLSFAFPAIFLSIAAFMTSAVLTRLIRLQREQIAQLKAFGYSSRQVGFHYFKFALVIVVIGTTLGGICGYAISAAASSRSTIGFFDFLRWTFSPITRPSGLLFLSAQARPSPA